MTTDAPAITLTPSRFVTISLASAVTGYSPRAIESKIEKGVWLEGVEYVRAPDGRVLVDLVGYGRWVRGERK